MDNREEEYKRRHNKDLISTFFYSIVILGLAVVVTFLFRNLFVGFVAVVVGIIVVFLSTRDKSAALKADFKDVVVVEMLKKKFVDFKYNIKEGISESHIANLNLFDNWKVFSSSDYLSSNYNSVNFYMSNLSIKGISKNVFYWQDSTYDSYFHGQWYVFRFDKKFRYDLIAATKSLTVNFKAFRDGRFKTCDKEFDKIYKMWSLDENDSFETELPNQQLLDRLLYIKETLGCGIVFIFKDNELQIGVDSGMTFFEQRKFVGMNVSNEKEDIAKEVETLTFLIDSFKDDSVLFKN